MEQGITFYDPQHHRPFAALYGQDPKVGCLYFAALTLWLCGYPDQAVQRANEAIAVARELARPFSLAGALSFAAAVHQFRHEGSAAQQRAEEAISLSTEHGFPQWLMVGAILRGWALAVQGQSTEGIAQMQKGLAAQRASGAEMSRSYFLSLLAESYNKTGQIAEGLNAITEALAVVDKNSEHVAEAELYRLKGELLLAQEGFRLQAVGFREKTEEAEECFLTAISLARRQGAKSWELRAATSLARLWQRQGKHQEARNTLSEIYGWFTEGFDTADLLTAKTLLDQLG
jgi:adenylate cyclase